MIPTSVYDTEKADQEMQAQYGMGEAPQKPAFLYVERGPGAGQLLEVKQGTIVIGRASVSDLRLQHPSISRRHAQVRRIGDQFFVKDLGSQNGSFVNKTRIANEVEVKIGDTLALGNALLRLRGPMQRGEKPATSTQNGKARVPTAVVARPPQYSTGQHRAASSNRMVKIAVFAGAVGFGLAAVLAFALIKMATGGTTPTASSKEKSPKSTVVAEVPNDAIGQALKKKQDESRAVVAAAAAAKPPEPVAVAEEPVAEEPTIDDSPAVVKSVPGVAPSVAPAKAPAKIASAKRPSSSARAAASDEEEAPAKGGAKRTQILAPYERGNAEGSLELAKSAGDKELSDKLLKFISSYDSGQEALISNNGTVAIKEFTKALALDEQLSNGWGKYGSEIRKHLGNLYFLVGKQYEANGDDAKAKAAYQAALKNDPANGKAKGAIAKLNGGGEEEEAAPAPKPAPKKAPSKTSIDDAFGD